MSKALIFLTSDAEHLQLAIEATVVALPGASITLVAQDDIAKGLEGIAGVEDIITTARAGEISFSLSRSFISRVRAEQYSLCVVLQKTRATRIGVRAIGLAHLVRSKKKSIHIKDVGFVPLRRATLSLFNPYYLLRVAAAVVDKVAAIAIRRGADLIVGFVLWRDRRRARRLGKGG